MVSFESTMLLSKLTIVHEGPTTMGMACIWQSLSTTSADGSTRAVNIEEDVLSQDETTSYPNRVPVFHGYSFTGSAEADYVYVGRGQQADFERLVALGVPLEGKIALARYGGPFRGLKVKNAQEHGMIGCVIFTDTGDDGNVTEANGYAAYPEGYARNPSTVQRGSVQFLSTYPGDPTTPGYPSKPDSPRVDTAPVTPRIPSLPISYVEGQKLIQALDGYGTPGDAVNRTSWVGAFNATYSTGPNPGATLNLGNVMQDNTTYIWDAVGIINGTSQDEVIVLGNHRDAWIVGGNADPNSGSAILVELSKAFGALLKTGWQPKRTIVLCSWDAEEYGLLGSTEFVEEYIPWLKTAAVSYLNIDVGVSGPDPSISATPDLHQVAVDTMKKIVYPYRGYDNLTLYDVWFGLSDGDIGVLGSGSDYTSFVHNGISSIDMGTDPGPTDAIYHYHSDYDSYHWMSTFGDPGYGTHKVMGQYLSLLAYNLATAEVIPYNVENYGAQMTSYLADLQDTVAGSNYSTLDLSPIASAISTFNTSAATISSLIASNPDTATVATINARLRDFSRGFVSQGGLPNREFYKHVVFAPGLDTGYAPTTFPGVTEAIENYMDQTMAEEQIQRTSRGIEAAAQILSPA
ncbi:MAG: hypothetical protein Q9162_001316 [Coniocarpon cinnabarinum]